MLHDEFFLFGASRGTAFAPRRTSASLGPIEPIGGENRLRRRLGRALERVGERVAATGRAVAATPLSLAEIERL